ncbi:MAG: TetR/AcrR family transcriptional regulator [Acidimicrobiales bacterium]
MRAGIDGGHQVTTGRLAWLAGVADDLLERPDPVLDEALNAAVTCFMRHGVAHTSVRDIAAELGVSKATVYRQVGSVDVLARVLLARDVHRLVDAVVGAAGDAEGPAAALDAVTAAAVFICHHPLVQKVLADEPDLAAELLGVVPVIASSITDVLASVIENLIPLPRNGSSAAVCADVAVRVVVAAVFIPPVDLETCLHDALGPHLGM